MRLNNTTEGKIDFEYMKKKARQAIEHDRGVIENAEERIEEIEKILAQLSRVKEATNEEVTNVIINYEVQRGQGNYKVLVAEVVHPPEIVFNTTQIDYVEHIVDANAALGMCSRGLTKWPPIYKYINRLVGF